MDRANELVLHGAGDHEFVSAFFGLIDGGTGHMAYSLAGHPSPMLVRGGSGEVTPLPSDGAVLGAAGGMRYENRGVVLDPGDMLVMYTDGLIEARSPRGETFGTDRLLRAMAASADEPAASVPESLFLSAFSFAEGHLADDVAIVALRHTGAGDGFNQGRLELDSAVA
jgi:sigma-B regulation protein RsbU (phosphoserine phosphatase)